MKRHSLRQFGKGALELIEEATHLLRLAPSSVLASYYVGTLPFVLGFLYFWADMSRSAFAFQRLASSTLVLAGLFLWMKCWQTVFARRLRTHVSAEPPSFWMMRRFGRVLVVQAILQPTGLFLLPLALIPAIPFAWLYAFYQNVTALTDGESTDVKIIIRKSWQQAALWPQQNHLVLTMLIAFGGMIFLNLMMVCLLLPQLLRIFFGVESVFTQSLASMLNTTFISGILGLTYLCVDPLVKTVYVLRCFYGESLKSGEDLKAELKKFAAVGSSAAAPALG
jgi:hypothetical protein